METMSGSKELRKCTPARSAALDMPEDIDRDALRILSESGFAWDPGLVGFRRSSSSIDYAFLREQKLVAGANLSGQDRIGQLQRLRILVQSID